MACIDLHTHSLASDGTDSPALLVRNAAAAGLCAIAVTDHDTVGGLSAAEAQGIQSGIEVLRGCELSARNGVSEMHILGLWLPQDTTVLEQTLISLREHRAVRNYIIIEKLQALGIDISYDQVLDVSQGESVGRPHMAAVMVAQGYVKDSKEAFARYLGYKGKAYESKKILSPVEAVSLLAGLGATVSLAHPCLNLHGRERIEETVRELKEHGLAAIEAYHSDHSQADQRLCVDVAAKYGLTLTGGSDYHGTAKARISLGTGYGSLRVPLFVLDALKEQRVKLGLPI